MSNDLRLELRSFIETYYFVRRPGSRQRCVPLTYRNGDERIIVNHGDGGAAQVVHAAFLCL